MDIIYEKDRIVIKKPSCFSLEQTLDCGQAFRWEKDQNGVWSGIARGKQIRLFESDGDIIVLDSSQEDFSSIWADYFDLSRDYEGIIADLSQNEILRSAAAFGSGIRILNQEPWEALCSFIISQNNNIPRIKGIIKRLCENFGEKVAGGYCFPSADTLAPLSPEDLSELRSGFRAKYIIDAARRVASGEIDLEALKSMHFENAQSELLKIKGVGPKVADCALLFGLGHIEAFPKDVWIKRALSELFGGELPDCAKQYAGIAQQYIFYYIRERSRHSIG